MTGRGRAREAILSFFARVTKEGGPDFGAPAECIAVFDNDGTLWSEQPMYVQIAFAIERVKALAQVAGDAFHAAEVAHRHHRRRPLRGRAGPGSGLRRRLPLHERLPGPGYSQTRRQVL